MAGYKKIKVPSKGKKIVVKNGQLQIPDKPIIGFIEGDGIGSDIWRASKYVFDAAVEKAYSGKRKIYWIEIYAGEKAYNKFSEWLPQETVDAIAHFKIAIKAHIFFGHLFPLLFFRIRPV